MSLFQNCSPCLGESSHSSTIAFFKIVMIRVMCEQVQLKICGKPCLEECAKWPSRAGLQKGLPIPQSFPFTADVTLALLGARKMDSAVVAKLGMKRLIWYHAVASSEMGWAGGTAVD